ncbi:MAG: efflux RND transporter periplasmic adaptor subunit, partial [Kofleriaceae bacterium]
GQVVELTAVANPEQTFKAKVTRISGEIGRTRSLIVEATIDPGSNLVPGMFAEARVKVGETTRIVLPKEAVVRRGKVWHAFVEVKGSLEDRIVQLGPVPGEGKVSIVQGVNKGDKVVAKVTDQVIDGLRVAE